VKWEKCTLCDVCAGLPIWMSHANSRAGKKNRVKPSNRAVTERLSFERTSTVPVNEELREFLREWRRITAREKMTAAFIVLHDTVLDELCARKPRNLQELRQISGIGEKKCEMYGKQILELFARFEKGERASREWRAKPSSASGETLELLQQGHSFEEIARIRGRKVASVVALVADLVEQGKLELREDWIPAERRQQIREICGKVGLEWMKPIKEALPEEVTVEEIRLVLAEMRRENKAARNT
jgi:ATP-dependent DNA helicase RecQ